MCFRILKKSRLDGLLFFLTAKSENVVLGAEHGESLDRCLDNVGVVVGANGFGENIVNAHGLTHGTHTTTRNDAGSGRCGLEENLATTKLCIDFVRNGRTIQLNLLKALVGNPGSLLDALGNFVGFSESNSNGAFFVTRDDESGEAEATSTFHHFRTAVNKHNLFSQFISFRVGRCWLALAAAEATALVSTTLARTASAVKATTPATIVTATVVRTTIGGLLIACWFCAGWGCVSGFCFRWLCCWSFSRLGVFVICHFGSEQELEFKTTFAGGIGKGFDLACEEEAATVEDNCFDFGISGTLGDQFTNSFGSCLAGSGGLDG